MAELIDGKVRRCAAAKINEVRPARADKRLSCVNGKLVDEGVGVSADFFGVLVGVNLEVTKVTTFAAEWNVRVDTERRVRARRTLNSGLQLIDLIRTPEGI